MGSLGINDVDMAEDWQEVVPQGKPPLVADVTLRLHVPEKRGAPKAILVFRGEAAEFVRSAATRYRVQAAGHKLRVVPDNIGGKFEWYALRSVVMLWVTGLPWPRTNAGPFALEWAEVNGALLLVIAPHDMAQIRTAGTVAAKVLAPAPVPDIWGGRQPLVRGAVVPMGEPEPGRSALDQRRAGK